MDSIRARAALSAASICLALCGAAAPALAGVTTRASLNDDGVEGDSSSYNPAISATGRFVVFQSGATNFDPADPVFGSTDIYLRDTKLGTTQLVSVNSAGVLADNFSAFPVVSKNGRYVAWESLAANLVEGDLNAKFDIFVRDMKTGETTRISVASAGTEGDKDSFNPQISDNGRYVAFQSDATNLVELDSNQRTDVFLHDRKTGTTTRVSVDSDGNQGGNNSGGPSLSSNGRYIAFYSESVLAEGDTADLVDVYVHDRKKGSTTWTSPNGAGAVANGGSADPSISSNGRYVAFLSSASDLVEDDAGGFTDIFLRDRKKGVTTRISVDAAGSDPDSSSVRPVISGNGKFIAFESFATDLLAVAGNGNIATYVRDLKQDVTTLASVSTGGTQADENCTKPGITKTGRYVTFFSVSDELVAGDGNKAEDVFVRDRKD